MGPGLRGLGAVGHVRLDGESPSARALDLFYQRVEAVLAPGRQRDRGTVAASVRAVASPMPLEAPVIRAAVPSSRSAISTPRPLRLFASP